MSTIFEVKELYDIDVDGNTQPTPDGDEIAEVVWLGREDIPVDESRFSLTWDMIEEFRPGKI